MLNHLDAVHTELLWYSKYQYQSYTDSNMNFVF